MDEMDMVLDILKSAGGYGGLLLIAIAFIVALWKKWLSFGKNNNPCPNGVCKIQEKCMKRFDTLDATQQKIGSDLSTIKQALYAVFNFIKKTDEKLIVPDL